MFLVLCFSHTQRIGFVVFILKNKYISFLSCLLIKVHNFYTFHSYSHFNVRLCHKFSHVHKNLVICIWFCLFGHVNKPLKSNVDGDSFFFFFFFGFVCFSNPTSPPRCPIGSVQCVPSNNLSSPAFKGVTRRMSYKYSVVSFVKQQ